MRGAKLVAVGCGIAALALVSGVASAAEGPEPIEWVGKTLDKCCFGGDVRIRQVHLDKIPRGPGAWDENHFFRFRTRLWGQLDVNENVTVRGRLVNEFREYAKPDDTDAWEFPDETVVDQLYVDMRNLIDGKLDLRIGRQDLIYGTGKLILEGSPFDGSRTIYLDAAKATWKGVKNTTIDVFGISMQAENDLAIDSQDRALTFNGVDETGGGIYVRNSTMAEMPAELYYIFKNEDEYTAVATDAAGLTTSTPVEDADVHTAGLRLMPKWPGDVSGNIEAAAQFGEQGDVDIEAFGVDAQLKWMLPVLAKHKPCLAVGYYYLSGDDPDTADKNEGWNPLWARYPQHSELYVYAHGGYWSNLAMPYADLSLAINDRASVSAMVGQMDAPEAGPGGGDERGLLGVCWARFNIAEKLLTESDKLTGHLLYEVLDVGDFHVNSDDTAHFARWELFYAF